MGLWRAGENSIHIGLGGDCPSKEVKYFINIISFILLNFLRCGIYYSQLPDGQLTAQKCMISPKARDGCVSLCSVQWAWTDGLAHCLGHSTGNVQNPFWVWHGTRDTGARGDRGEWRPVTDMEARRPTRRAHYAWTTVLCCRRERWGDAGGDAYTPSGTRGDVSKSYSGAAQLSPGKKGVLAVRPSGSSVQGSVCVHRKTNTGVLSH